MPPEIGLGVDVLFDMVASQVGEANAKIWWEWFTTTHPNWGREGWTRIDKARAEPPCAS